MDDIYKNIEEHNPNKERNDMDDIYKNIEQYNPNKKCKILIVFDDMITNMLSNKTVDPIVTALFIRDKKLNVSFVFIMQSYFAVPKNFRLNSTHYLIKKFANKTELQQILYRTATANDT